MIGIIEKELKELGRAAFIAFLAVCAIVAFGFYSPAPEFVARGILDERFRLLFTLASPAIALLFGVVQTLPEMHRGAWAVLVHRPISRTSILVGKLVAGVIAHLVVVSVPVLVGVYFTPSGAPAQAFLGVGFDVFVGPMFWSAGALIGLRQVRWHGTRLLPGFAAVFLYAYASGLPSAVPAFVLAAGGAVALFGAAWGAFTSRWGLLPSAALVGVLAAGATCVGICVFGTATYLRMQTQRDVRYVGVGKDRSFFDHELFPRMEERVSFRSRFREEEHPFAQTLGGASVIAARETGTRHTVWTPRNLYVVDDRRFRLVLPLTPNATYASIAVTPMTNDVVTVRFDPPLGEGDSEIVQYTSDGAVRNRYFVPNVARPKTEPGLEDGLFGAIVPPVLNLATRDVQLRWGSPKVPSEGFRIFVILSVVQMIAAAGINVLFARRHRLSVGAHVGWALAGLAFGVAGVVAALGILDFPARVSCGSCKKMRLVDRDHCEHCDAAFPSPTRDGTEIFESVGQLADAA